FYTYIVPAWPISIEGRQKIRRDATYVFVSNHQSQLDILALFRLFVHFKWVSKVEIFKVPLIGWNMVLNRYIKLVRGDKQSIAQMMADSEERLAEGSSVFIFPEGTRSPDGHLKAFKQGAFILAKKMKVAIMPIIIEGTRKALPKYSINFHGKHPIKIRVLEEIPYASFANLTVEELLQKVWDYIHGELLKLQKEMEPAGA
ncbi:MAG TPA: 1-acyl-sn-glycerol-3-phosphate acyltransferase, partial [Spirochaetes bacterium]|nr:1-acyl-sn-glycerol-3-phosphate acyltransferase [Spirochaetota bacterium]